MATVPPAPSLYLPGHTGTTVSVNAGSNGDGGSPILQWRVGYGISSTAPTTYQNLNEYGNGTVTGLQPGTVYYFWAQARNALGWSARSVRMSAKTWDYPAPPSAPRLTDVKTSSLQAFFTDNDNGGAVVYERQIGWGLSPEAPTYAVPMGDRGVRLIDLPGVTPLYFRGRVRNSVGWSKWGPSTTITLPAGAWITIVTHPTPSTTRVMVRPAVVYVKVAGVWKVATPMVRVAGLWKETR